MCTASDQTLNYIQVRFNEYTNTTEFVDIIYKYIKYCYMIKLYNLYSNEITFGYADITAVSTHMEETRSNKK